MFGRRRNSTRSSADSSSSDDPVTGDGSLIAITPPTSPAQPVPAILVVASQPMTLNPTSPAQPGQPRSGYQVSPPDLMNRNAGSNVTDVPKFELPDPPPPSTAKRIKHFIAPYINGTRLIGAAFITVVCIYLLFIAALLFDYFNEKNGVDVRLSLLDFTKGDKIFLAALVGILIAAPLLFLLFAHCCCGPTRNQPENLPVAEDDEAFVAPQYHSIGSLVSDYPVPDKDQAAAKNIVNNVLAILRAVLFAGFLVGGLISLILGIAGLLQEKQDINIKSGFTFSDWRFDTVAATGTSLLFAALALIFSLLDRMVRQHAANNTNDETQDNNGPRNKVGCCCIL